MSEFLKDSNIVWIELTDVVSNASTIIIEKEGIEWKLGCLFHNILQDVSQAFISYFQTQDDANWNFRNWKEKNNVCNFSDIVLQ